MDPHTKARIRSALKDHLNRTPGEPQARDFGAFGEADRAALAREAAAVKKLWTEGDSTGAFEAIEDGVERLAQTVRFIEELEEPTDPRELAKGIQVY